MMRHTAILAVAFVTLSTIPALAQSDTVNVEGKQFQALTGLPQVPAPLSDNELAAIEGQGHPGGGAILANSHALPANNPGTAIAAGFPAPLGDGAIPSGVFLGTVTTHWFGRAAGK